ncbi:MAG: WecB/TagA/CpsF family glycosyltransferase [Hydrococcus sp. C42_A2020_068]|uniref:WecB/TagA/CpsF family glycosyltransferase n=1 Tax=Pleurocapsa sp. PCC 7327 TaxID=118163 RepID=UPI00029FC1C0|nr:WecB/TagA/CpsF family glycosyltransferase [Pleurocapsa sp. PCC 7327]AFY76473.1 exopolysaccharide biosynthesis protein, WecB/TagA/CpsF family [Pleurocapsa sp. PCC 7327]MBF2018727.1 WecB/TagA/CpsF family glycosyltransferase [Hydrococcus sp. C42_A2020_068]
MKAVNILNTSIHNLSKLELLEKLNRSGGVVVTPNVDHLMKLRKDPELRVAYQKADFRVCDSKIIQYASIFLGQPIREKISGSDFFPAFYEYNKHNPEIKIFLLGAREGIAKQAKEKINQKVGREIIVGYYSPSIGFEKNEEECQKILELIRKSGATVVAVGLGAPKQEKWITKYREQLKTIKIFLAIGATIDFEAGYKPRSPKWMSEVGLEWFYRLICEPKRLWKRYLLEGIPFFALIIKQKFMAKPIIPSLSFTSPRKKFSNFK